jgi:hypothetical protein
MFTRIALLVVAALVGQASANQQCVTCYAGCCGGSVAICGAGLAWWNPPAFLPCAAANCGGTCQQLCNSYCYPTDYGR